MISIETPRDRKAFFPRSETSMFGLRTLALNILYSVHCALHTSTLSGPTINVTSHSSGRWARNPRSAIRLLSSYHRVIRSGDKVKWSGHQVRWLGQQVRWLGQLVRYRGEVRWLGEQEKRAGSVSYTLHICWSADQISWLASSLFVFVLKIQQRILINSVT